MLESLFTDQDQMLHFQYLRSKCGSICDKMLTILYCVAHCVACYISSLVYLIFTENTVELIPSLVGGLLCFFIWEVTAVWFYYLFAETSEPVESSVEEDRWKNITIKQNTVIKGMLAHCFICNVYVILILISNVPASSINIFLFLIPPLLSIPLLICLLVANCCINGTKLDSNKFASTLIKKLIKIMFGILI